MKALKALLQAAIALVVFAPLNALVTSWACSTMWAWFVASRYGRGPSYEAWFGISGVVNLWLTTALINYNVADKDDDEDGSRFMRACARSIGLCIGLAIIVGISWITGKVIGWL